MGMVNVRDTVIEEVVMELWLLKRVLSRYEGESLITIKDLMDILEQYEQEAKEVLY